jgi:hypothetical protein
VEQYLYCSYVSSWRRRGKLYIFSLFYLWKSYIVRREGHKWRKGLAVEGGLYYLLKGTISTCAFWERCCINRSILKFTCKDTSVPRASYKGHCYSTYAQRVRHWSDLWQQNNVSYRLTNVTTSYCQKYTVVTVLVWYRPAHKPLVTLSFEVSSWHRSNAAALCHNIASTIATLCTVTTAVSINCRFSQ